MTLVVTHPYVSTIAESTGSGVAGGTVGPNEWNANHTLTGVASPAQGGTGITSGTGVTYFSSATVLADSGTLTANALVLGGGANGAPTTVSSLGTTSTLLHGNASGAPSFGAVNLGSEVAGTLSTGNLTAATTALFGIVKPDNTTVTISSGVISASAATNPGGISGSIQYNNSNAFGGFGFYDGIKTVLVGSTSTSSGTYALQVYNTLDSLTSPANYERGVIDWVTTSNVLTIGSQAAGTGTLRNVRLEVGAGNANLVVSNSNVSLSGSMNLVLNGGGKGISLATGNGNCAISIGGTGTNNFAFGPTGNDTASLGYTPGGAGSAMTNVITWADNAPVVLGPTNAVTAWLNYAGQSRVAANSTTTSTAFANVPGLSFIPKANRNYSFEAHLIFTDAATGGIQCTVNATSTTTTYTLTFDGYLIDTTAVRGYAQGSAFGNVVASSLTTGTLGHVTITGTLMTSATAPSTFTVQFAQNTSNATPTTILIGSYMWVHDMP